MSERPRGEGFVEAHITCESGRWVVSLDIVTDGGVVRHRIADFHTEQKARLAAHMMRAAAERESR